MDINFQYHVKFWSILKVYRSQTYFMFNSTKHLTKS